MNYTERHHQTRTGTNRSEMVLKALIKIADERGRIESRITQLSKQAYLGVQTISGGLKRLQHEGHLRYTAAAGRGDAVTIQLSENIVKDANGPAHDPFHVPQTTWTEFANSVIKSHALRNDTDPPEQ